MTFTYNKFDIHLHVTTLTNTCKYLDIKKTFFNRFRDRNVCFAKMHFYIHMGREHASREKKIAHGKFFDFRAQKCI